MWVIHKFGFFHAMLLDFPRIIFNFFFFSSSSSSSSPSSNSQRSWSISGSANIIWLPREPWRFLPSIEMWVWPHTHTCTHAQRQRSTQVLVRAYLYFRSLCCLSLWRCYFYFLTINRSMMNCLPCHKINISECTREYFASANSVTSIKGVGEKWMPYIVAHVTHRKALGAKTRNKAALDFVFVFIFCFLFLSFFCF